MNLINNRWFRFKINSLERNKKPEFIIDLTNKARNLFRKCEKKIHFNRKLGKQFQILLQFYLNSF